MQIGSYPITSVLTLFSTRAKNPLVILVFGAIVTKACERKDQCRLSSFNSIMWYASIMTEDTVEHTENVGKNHTSKAHKTSRSRNIIPSRSCTRCSKTEGCIRRQPGWHRTWRPMLRKATMWRDVYAYESISLHIFSLCSGFCPAERCYLKFGLCLFRVITEYTTKVPLTCLIGDTNIAS